MSKHKENERRKKKEKKQILQRKKRKNGHITASIKFPENFSFLENYEKNIDFINSIENKVNKNTTTICLDMYIVKKIDVSALMYTDVILKILKKRYKNLKFEAYYPSNFKMKNYLEKCGFAYVQKDDSNSFKIIQKNKVDTNIIVDIMSYLEKNNIRISRSSQKALYSILLELMDNTKQHAYDKKSVEDNWYFYLEFDDEKVKFVFLDNGKGITTTIRIQNFLMSFNGKKFKIAEDLSETIILKMALAGGYFLSSTKQKNRNKGLPNIYEKLNNKDIKNLKIISRKACFNINSDIDLQSELKGTLFYWEVDVI